MFAKVISIIFVPPSIGLLINLYVAFDPSTDKSHQWPIVITGILFSFVIPILFFLIFKAVGIVADLDVSNKDERTVPYLMGIALSIIAFYIVNYLNLPPVVKALWLIVTLNGVFLAIINEYWKISAHAWGISTLFACILWFSAEHSIIVFVFVLLVAWSRLKLKKHTPLQVLFGSLLGFTLTYFQFEIIVDILR